MMGAGRPTKYDPKFAKIAQSMCKLGATDAEVADALDVAVSTIWRWSSTIPEFCSALKVGKEQNDDRAEVTLFKRAMGYEYKSEKIFQFQGEPVIVPYTEHVQPDVTALIFWLKNRRPDKWRQQPEAQPADSDQTIQTVRIEVVNADHSKGN